MSLIEIITIGISVIAVLLALWQGFLSRAQLEQAKNTKNDTEKLLDEIKQKVVKIESISDETRKDVKDQVGKLIDKQDENFKLLLSTPKENSQNEMIKALLPDLLKNPDVLKQLMQLGNGKK